MFLFIILCVMNVCKLVMLFLFAFLHVVVLFLFAFLHVAFLYVLSVCISSLCIIDGNNRKLLVFDSIVVTDCH